MVSADPQKSSEWRGHLRGRLVSQAQPSVEENRLQNGYHDDDDEKRKPAQLVVHVAVFSQEPGIPDIKQFSVVMHSSLPDTQIMVVMREIYTEQSDQGAALLAQTYLSQNLYFTTVIFQAVHNVDLCFTVDSEEEIRCEFDN